MVHSVAITSLQERNKSERALQLSRDHELPAEELRDWMALPSSPTARLGVRTVSDFPAVIRTMTESSRAGEGGMRRLYLARNCPDYQGIRINGVRITEGLLTI